jgi:hypothetical protein
MTISITTLSLSKECHNAVWHNDECCYAECKLGIANAECRNQVQCTDCHYAECFYTECCNETHYADCRYAECHFGDCHGAQYIRIL